MTHMFQTALLFDQPIGLWKTSAVTDMSYMFSGASSFNSDISTFDTSAVTNMEGMFIMNPAFDIDVSDWDTSLVSNMNLMFYGASKFNQDLCKWRFNFPYTAATEIFVNSGCLFTANPVLADRAPFCATNSCVTSQPSSSVSPSSFPSGSPSLPPGRSSTTTFTNTDTKDAKEKAKGLMVQMQAESSDVTIEKISFKMKDDKESSISASSTVQVYLQLG